MEEERWPWIEVTSLPDLLNPILPNPTTHRGTELDVDIDEIVEDVHKELAEGSK